MKEAMRQLCKEDEGEKKDGGLKEEVEDEEKECEEEAEEEGGDPRMRRDGDEGNRGDATKDFEKNPSLDPAITVGPLIAISSPHFWIISGKTVQGHGA
ncbi:hypothetical protein CDL15_Pgr026800 [Punica granatum]|uniref:Uncharacterized protein n=1 Tax=Punica granatum TaxID=22663 RepID=A0A218WM26_PUNGR|nr:hypothetical protein CDL15_Pgr026800 [Punica granatum]